MKIDKDQLLEWLRSESIESAAFKQNYEKGIIHGIRRVLNEVKTGRFDAKP